MATFRFFNNDYDTETEGFDVVATYSLDSDFGVTNFNLAYNKTETEVTKRNIDTVSDNRKRQLETGLPETRYNLSATHLMDNWRFLGRYRYYDDWYDSEDGQVYDGYGMVDAEVGYSFDQGVTIVVGADNITDETPDRNPGAAGGVGNKYSQFSPGGFNGRFMYMRVMYDF